MREANAELGSAVTEALDWMGATPETAGAALGINARTLDAMCRGIVPMRSLVLRFATAMARQCESQTGVPDWWCDVDAWLQVAGYSPRRDQDGVSAPRPSSPATAPRFAPLRSASAPASRPPASAPRPAPARPAVAVAEPGEEGEVEPAGHYYRPVYERKTLGDDLCVHLFWILDGDGVRRYQISIGAHEDYRARAAQVKQDLQNLSRDQFERRYARHRINSPEA
ncbi:MAG: hypothetical protein ACK47B_21380 [Armatimonadota bacterium]